MQDLANPAQPTTAEPELAALAFGNVARLQSGLAHDMRGPLNNMMLYLELVRRGIEKAAAGDAEALERCRGSVQVLQDEVRRLGRQLDLQRLVLRWPDAEVRTFDLREWIDELAGVLRPHCQDERKELRVTSRLDAPVAVRGPRLRLAQAVLALLVRAVDRMTEGAELELVLEASAAEARLRVNLGEGSGTTGDRGTGIDQTVAEAVLREAGGGVSPSGEGGTAGGFVITLPRVAEPMGRGAGNPG